MYVANSEPARWCWGAGRADVTRRDLISGEANRHEAGRDMGRWCVLPREALRHCHRTLREMAANQLDEETPKRGGAEGGRFTGSTDDSGPMKQGQPCGGQNPDDQERGNNSASGVVDIVINSGEAVDER